MSKPIDKLQHPFFDFNQPMGLCMNPDNRWIKLADRIPWDEFESELPQYLTLGDKTLVNTGYLGVLAIMFER